MSPILQVTVGGKGAVSRGSKQSNIHQRNYSVKIIKNNDCKIFKMNWDNLSKGTCPKCDEVLKSTGSLICCDYCEFRIRLSKYEDLIKGKESKSYKSAISRFEKIKQYKKKEKDNYNKIFQDEKKEKILNLKRMLKNNTITKQEFDRKMSLLSTVSYRDWETDRKSVV